MTSGVYSSQNDSSKFQGSCLSLQYHLIGFYERSTLRHSDQPLLFFSRIWVQAEIKAKYFYSHPSHFYCFMFVGCTEIKNTDLECLDCEPAQFLIQHCFYQIRMSTLDDSAKPHIAFSVFFSPPTHGNGRVSGKFVVLASKSYSGLDRGSNHFFAPLLWVWQLKHSVEIRERLWSRLITRSHADCKSSAGCELQSSAVGRAASFPPCFLHWTLTVGINHPMWSRYYYYVLRNWQECWAAFKPTRWSWLSLRWQSNWMGHCVSAGDWKKKSKKKVDLKGYQAV